MSLDPAVVLIDHDTAAVIAKLPPFVSLPEIGWKLEVQYDDAPATLYEIKDIKLVAKMVTVSVGEEGPPDTSYGVETHVEVVVKLKGT